MAWNHFKSILTRSRQVLNGKTPGKAENRPGHATPGPAPGRPGRDDLLLKKIILISGAIAFALLGLEIVLYVIDENEYEQEIISECKTWWKSDTNVEVCLVEGNEHVENCPKIESDDYGKKYCILGEKTYQEFLEP